MAELQVPITIDRLDSADYAFLDVDGEAEGIERCSIGNLVQKLVSGELESQLERCSDAYKRVMLLTEGVYGSTGGLLTVYKNGKNGYFRTRVYPSTNYGYVVSSLVRLSDFGVELIHTPDFDCTMKTVATIYKQRTKEHKDRKFFAKIRPVKIPQKISSDPAIGRLMALCPRMPERVALALVIKYGNIWNILNASDKELLAVDGFGLGLLNKLKETVGK